MENELTFDKGYYRMLKEVIRCPEVVSMSGLKESRANEAKTTKLFSIWSRLATLMAKIQRFSRGSV